MDKKQGKQKKNEKKMKNGTKELIFVLILVLITVVVCVMNFKNKNPKTEDKENVTQTAQNQQVTEVNDLDTEVDTEIANKVIETAQKYMDDMVKGDWDSIAKMSQDPIDDTMKELKVSSYSKDLITQAEPIYSKAADEYYFVINFNVTNVGENAYEQGENTRFLILRKDENDYKVRLATGL